MKDWSPLTWLVLSVLFTAMPPTDSLDCPPCEPGFIQENCKCVKCASGQFWSQRNGEAVCKVCTASCSVKRNQVEVTACTERTDRSCQCKPGYYCRSPVNLTCRRDCEPCTNGFTNTSNLNRLCIPYRDCASLGMKVIKNGSLTMDRVCGYEPSPKKLIQTSDSPSVTSVSSETKAQPGKIEEIAATKRGGPGSPSEPLSKTTWILTFLLLVALCLLLYLCIKCKTRSIKNKLEWAGRAFARYQPMFPNSNTETLRSVSATDAARDAREAQGQGSSQGNIQQVTMEHVGKADGINNTVGSIFIYSPGMVILGSNSNEKKEEAETSGDDGGEVTCLMSVPQQESSSEEDIRVATQEELGKELSVPVPATSK